MTMAPIELPHSDGPLVSIVVLVTGPALAARVLEAIAGADEPSIPCEVIVVVNTTDAETRSLVTVRAKGARALMRDVNTGTAVGWNLGFGAARGEYVALLHEDSAPESGWLEGMLTGMAKDPRAAVVGSRLLHFDGRFQGGGIIAWRDGSATWVTEENAPEAVAGADPYPVSHACSAAMLVERAAWLEVGGFDERYFPAFRVEVDFGTALWFHGRTVINTPHSVVRHGLRSTVREDGDPFATRVFRKFAQESNRRKWLAKWHATLPKYPPKPPADARKSADGLVAGLEWFRARALEPPPATPPDPTAERAFTGPGEEGLDDRLAAAHQRVRDEFLEWLVQGIERERRKSRPLRRERNRLRSKLAARDARLERLTAKLEESEARASKLERRVVRLAGPRKGRRRLTRRLSPALDTAANRGRRLVHGLRR
jgi:GT2 family glycosyltransferase